MSLTTKTPAEIDTMWAGLASTLARAEELAERYQRLADTAKMSYTAADYAESAAKQREIVKMTRVSLAPLEMEWVRRGGWTRAFLVTNSNGHVHRSMSCSTCFPTTSYAWLTQVSGLPEAEIVAQAGEMACTVCYPTAPVEVRNRPCTLTTVEKAAYAAERAAKAAAKAAKAITMPDGTPLRGEYGNVGTEIGAERAAVQALADCLWYGPGGVCGPDTEDHPTAPAWRAFAERAAQALAFKRGTTVEVQRELLAAKAQAKFKRDMKAAV